MIFKRLILIYLVILASFSEKAYSQISKNTAVSINIVAEEMYYFVDSEKAQLYSAKKEGEVWSTGVVVESFNKHIASWVYAKTPFISFDGFTLYFSGQEKEEDSFDLYYSKLEGDAWQDPVKLNLSDPKLDDMAPSLSADNKTLYFAKQNESGCYSIYRSKITTFGSWAAPMALPIPITVGCENYPLISADGNTLFFVSDRPTIKKNKRYQVYYSDLIDDEVWSVPEQISSAIDYDEFAPSIDYYRGEMHITRVANNKADLYVFKLKDKLFAGNFSVCKGIINNNGKPMSATIEVVSAFNETVAGVFQSDPVSGKYLVVIPSDGHYYLNFKSDKTANKSFYISATNGQILGKDIDLFENGNVKINIYDFKTMEAIDANITIENTDVVREALGVYKFLLPLNKNITATIAKAGYEMSELKISSSDLQFPNLEYGIALKPSLQTYELKVNDATTNNPITAKIILKSKNAEKPEIVQEMTAGFYFADIPKEEKYDLYVFSKGYMYFRTNIQTEGDRLRESLRINLIPLNRVGKISLDKITFIPNTAQFTMESKNELFALVEFLKTNPTVKTEFTVYYSNSTLGKDLADRRSTSLLSFFAANNIDSNRIILKSAILKDDTKSVLEAVLNF